MATIKDVAEHANVSVATVSKYLNKKGNVKKENEKAIREAIEELDYEINQIARGLKTDETMTIGVLIPSLENIFFTTVVSHIERELQQNNYSAIVCDYRRDREIEKEKINFLLKKKVDGIIMVPMGGETSLVHRVVNEGVPVVILDRKIKGVDSCDEILVDNINASYEAIEELIRHGHRRIGIISGPEDVYTAKQRLKGYYRVYEDYGLDIDEELIKYGDYQIQGGYDKLIELIELENPPTAIFVTNYFMTIGSIIAINEKEIKVPEDLSMIGFDNIQQLSEIVKPKLTIVVQPMKKLGITAAKTMLEKIKNNEENHKLYTTYRLKTNLINKGSILNLHENK